MTGEVHQLICTLFSKPYQASNTTMNDMRALKTNTEAEFVAIWWIHDGNIMSELIVSVRFAERVTIQ